MDFRLFCGKRIKDSGASEFLREVWAHRPDALKPETRRTGD